MVVADYWAWAGSAAGSECSRWDSRTIAGTGWPLPRHARRRGGMHYGCRVNALTSFSVSTGCPAAKRGRKGGLAQLSHQARGLQVIRGFIIEAFQILHSSLFTDAKSQQDIGMFWVCCGRQRTQVAKRR